MPRSLTARRPHPVEVRQLHSAMEKELTPRQRRRAEALVLHAAGLRSEMVRLAETLPAEMGLPYGRWSLSKLREYLLKRRVVKAISREHLRRELRKGGCAFGVSNAS